MSDVKPLSQMTVEEMQAWCDELRSAREALRNEALVQKAAREAKGITSDGPKVKLPKEKKTDVTKALAADMLKLMQGEE